jgi:hypothetical protein
VRIPLDKVPLVSVSSLTEDMFGCRGIL